VKADAQAILAAHLGLGDFPTDRLLPPELTAMVDDAFFENYRANLGRHAVMVPLHLRGSKVFQGTTLEGDEVTVTITSADDRITDMAVSLADLWRYPEAGVKLKTVEPHPEISGVAVFGLAQTMGPDGRLWASAIWDMRNAPVALLDPETFSELMIGNDRRRIDQVARRDSADPVSGQTAPWANQRAIGATAAQVYLADQQENPTDDGQLSLWWQVFRFDTLSVADSNGPPIRPGAPQRRHRLRGAVATMVSKDATGRSKLWAKGSSWRFKRPAADVDEVAGGDPEERLWGNRQVPGLEGDDGPGAPGPVSPRRRDEIAWLDRTGDTGIALAEGMPVSRILQSVVTPTSADRRAIGEVIRRLRDAGLSERQAYMLANAEAGFPHDEIARGFGCSVSTVANSVRAARRKLEQRS
jgi:DNA-binding CsgD family transcriptional regulator